MNVVAVVPLGLASHDCDTPGRGDNFLTHVTKIDYLLSQDGRIDRGIGYEATHCANYNINHPRAVYSIQRGLTSLCFSADIYRKCNELARKCLVKNYKGCRV